MLEKQNVIAMTWLTDEKLVLASHDSLSLIDIYFHGSEQKKDEMFAVCWKKRFALTFLLL